MEQIGKKSNMYAQIKVVVNFFKLFQKCWSLRFGNFYKFLAVLEGLESSGRLIGKIST